MKSATIRVVISLAVMNQWKIRQIIVNNAFLDGELTKEVFMDQREHALLMFKNQILYANSINLSMVSNRLQEPGIIN